MQSAAKLRKLSRPDDFELLTRAVKAELADDHLSAAIGTFREAVNLSRGLAELEEAAVRLGIELAGQILPRGSRLAKSLLLEAAAVDSGKIIPDELWTSLQEREREEAISGALNYAAIPPAIRQRLTALLEQYPDEPRLLSRLKSLPEATRPQPPPMELPEPRRAGIIQRWTQLAEANRNLLSTAATVAFTVAALGISAGLIWMNQHPLKKATADDQAWSAVNPHNGDLVESYLMSFPNGAHRGQAVHALAEIRIERRQSAEMREHAQH